MMVIPSEDTSFLAGGEVFGRLDFVSRGEGGSKAKPEILVGEIGVELLGYDGAPQHCLIGC
jgi:hypothetical protein